jgi:hypothetical protein
MVRKIILPSRQAIATPTKFGAAAANPAAAALSRGGFVLGGLGAAGLPPNVEAGLHALATDLGKSCTEAWKAVESGTGFFSRVTQKIVGSESSAAAMRSAATAQCNLAAAVKARVDRIVASGDAAAAQTLLREAIEGRWSDVSSLKATAALISVGGAADVVVQSGKDLVDDVTAMGQGWRIVLKYLPYIGVGIGALVAVSFARNLARRIPVPSQPVSGLSKRRRARRTSHRRRHA